MSSTSEPLSLSRPAGLGREARVIALVAMAHFTSHIHIMLLPPILGSVKEAFGVSYTEVALALTAFNVASALLQTPAGFLVDRVGPRRMLIGGLLVGSVAIAAAALSPDYWLFVVAYGLLGLANTVYHPADYSILSAAVDHKRIGKAFSIHTFAGYLGSGITPALVLACAAIWDWHGAFLFAALFSLAVALLMIVAGSVLPRRGRKPQPATARSDAKVGLDLLLSAPILRNLLFFFCISMAAAGVLVGGFIADRTPHHERVAAVGFAFTAAMAILLGWVDMPAAILIGVMSAGGLLNGVIQPSRDMMVRAVTPVGSFGKVFGFVSTGFNLGGMVSPLLYGMLMDRGEPRAIYLIVTAFIFLALLTAITRAKPGAKPAWTP